MPLTGGPGVAPGLADGAGAAQQRGGGLLLPAAAGGDVLPRPRRLSRRGGTADARVRRGAVSARGGHAGAGDLPIVGAGLRD